MFLSLIAALAAAAPPAPSLVRYAAVSLDPAGTRIAAVESRQVRGAPTSEHGSVVLRDTAGKVLDRRDPCEACSYAGLSWSPDGKALAVVASGGGTATLYLIEGPATRKVATIKGLAASPRWSPDGTHIAFLATQDATKETGATQPGVRQVGVIGEQEDSRRIAIVSAKGGEFGFASPVGTFVYEYDWMPDGRGFVGTAAEGNGDNQWWVASLRAFPIDGGMRTIAAPRLQLNYPRVSPDGRSIAFIGGLMSDFGSVGGDVYTVPIGGGEPTDVTPGAKTTFTSIQWRGPRLVASMVAGGSMGIATIDPATRKVQPYTVVAETFDAGDARVSLDRTGAHAAYATESFNIAPAIGFGPLGRAHAITRDNALLSSGLTPRDLHWHNGGSEVQGWLLAPPPGAVPASTADKQPMIAIVHGGPAAATTPRFPWGDLVSALSAKGYWLFEPNPRGSYGQGAAFVSANVKDFGGGDFDDIQKGVDAAIKAAPIDPDKIGIYGHSYGGFMTMWAVTHTKRFKAAVAGAGLSDWVAYYGQNGIDQWMIPYFGASAYDDPKTYDRLSPIRSIRDAKTPTLLYVGERDVETPSAQSLEFWHGLRAMNVPTQLVIYQDEGHGIRSPKNLTDRETRMIGWFDKYLGVQR